MGHKFHNIIFLVLIFSIFLPGTGITYEASTSREAVSKYPFLINQLNSKITDQKASSIFFESSTNSLYLPIIRRDYLGMIRIPAGEFQMGCDSAHNGGYPCASYELPLHTIYLDDYFIDIDEVTNVQYAAFLNDRGSNDCNGNQCINLHPDGHIAYQSGKYEAEMGYEHHPVIEVYWHGSDVYCKANGKRLPTEAEWEKAARGASDTRPYPWGDQSPDCTLVNSAGCVGDTSQVGSYPAGASPYGVMDMAGNVYEWVIDWYHPYYYSVSPYSNPPGPASGSSKVLRGGAWHNTPGALSVAFRNDFNPDSTYYSFGFRCARSP